MQAHRVDVVFKNGRVLKEKVVANESRRRDECFHGLYFDGRDSKRITAGRSKEFWATTTECLHLYDVQWSNSMMTKVEPLAENRSFSLYNKSSGSDIMTKCDLSSRVFIQNMKFFFQNLIIGFVEAFDGLLIGVETNNVTFKK